MAAHAAPVVGSFSLTGLSKATELKKRLWFTVAALIAFRLLSFIPLPGIDPLMLSSLFQTTQGGMLDLLNMFSAADWNA
jgi:preprotein translocase subunit SecY